MRDMLKHKGTIFAVGILMLITVMASYAKEKEQIEINNITLNVKSVERQLINGKLVLKLETEGIGTIKYGENQSYVVNIQQGFIARINIDHTSAGFKGGTIGKLDIPEYKIGPWGFKGSLSCDIYGCVGNTCNLSMIVRASTKNGGKLDMMLSGTFNKTNGEFGNLTGSGIITEK